MPYSAESLAALSDMELNDVVAELVMNREPEPGLLPWLRRRAVRRYAQMTGGEALSYRGSEAGMGLVFGALVGKGFTVGLAPGGIVWVTGNGKEMKYVGGVAMPRAVAIAAVLAVQEGERRSSRSVALTDASSEVGSGQNTEWGAYPPGQHASAQGCGAGLPRCRRADVDPPRGETYERRISGRPPKSVRGRIFRQA